jgi:hypothetical protein
MSRPATCGVLAGIPDTTQVTSENGTSLVPPANRPMDSVNRVFSSRCINELF